MRLALLAMPWPLFNRPSIQLGVLKGYLRKHASDLKVKAFHPYVKLAGTLGYELYHGLSETQWLAEALAAGLLFREKRKEIASFVKKKARQRGLKIEFLSLFSTIEKTLLSYLSSINWEDFNIVGFSVCLNQLFSSLWAASRIKQSFPRISVIFGGSGCAGDMGRSILKLFPFVDYVINGEGEAPFLALLKFLQGQGPFPSKGIFYRKNGEDNVIAGGGFWQLPASEIPSPIYEDYFKEVSRLPASKRFFPIIPLEASRGCWWHKCNFCNLNLQWKGYRTKSLSQVLREIRFHARGGLLDFAFMDNCLSPQQALSMFHELAKDRVDYRIFAELRAVYKRKDYILMRQGGLTWVQIGIEALSTSLLRRINKGTTTIDNIAAMRHCEEVGLKLEANLIMHFPGTTDREIKETLEALDFVFPYRPLSLVSFWLGFGSPVYLRPKDFGLKRIFPHPYYKKFLPQNIFSSFVPLAWNYIGDKKRQKKIWKPIEDRVNKWRKTYLRLKAEKGPLLSYREGSNFLIIRQVLPEGKVLHHRLMGLSRDIYLYLTDIRHMEEIKERFSQISLKKLKAFLQDLIEKRLVFKEEDRYLALAIKRQNCS